jgi:serine/alanine adding enzyme
MHSLIFSLPEILDVQKSDVKITHLGFSRIAAWDTFVLVHESANLYHLSGWRNVIRSTYGHSPHYLMASRNDTISGILPLIHLKSLLFGNSLVSMPFFDMGGILAEDIGIERALLDEAVRLARDLGADLDLRHDRPLSRLGPHAVQAPVSVNKVRMLLELPHSSEALFASLKSKLRSQIRKPIKEGLKTRIGGEELIRDFYTVFAKNMRDLGSPVHSINLIGNVLKEFRMTARIIMVYKEQTPVASGLVIPFKHTMQNPWASALREYSRLSPNMLLYWAMLEYACQRGCRYFDFGRSTPGEGTYHFKEQWGAKPEALHWYYFSRSNPAGAGNAKPSEKAGFSSAIRIWKRLPVPVTRVFGPLIRKHISL